MIAVSCCSLCFHDKRADHDVNKGHLYVHVSYCMHMRVHEHVLIYVLKHTATFFPGLIVDRLTPDDAKGRQAELVDRLSPVDDVPMQVEIVNRPYTKVNVRNTVLVDEGRQAVMVDEGRQTVLVDDAYPVDLAASKSVIDDIPRPEVDEGCQTGVVDNLIYPVDDALVDRPHPEDAGTRQVVIVDRLYPESLKQKQPANVFRLHEHE